MNSTFTGRHKEEPTDGVAMSSLVGQDGTTTQWSNRNINRSINTQKKHTDDFPVFHPVTDVPTMLALRQRLRSLLNTLFIKTIVQYCGNFIETL
jgi:hypothetical protein